MFSLNDEGLVKMPIWATDKRGNILKVKTTFVVNIQDFIKHALHIISMNFVYDHMGELSVKGFYAKITKLVSITPPPGMEIEVAGDN